MHVMAIELPLQSNWYTVCLAHNSIWSEVGHINNCKVHMMPQITRVQCDDVYMQLYNIILLDSHANSHECIAAAVPGPPGGQQSDVADSELPLL